MTTLRTAAKGFLGTLFVLQGLGHGVVLLRGAGGGTGWSLLVSVLTDIAIVGFVAAGLGLFGVRPFANVAKQVTHLSALSSLGALALVAEADLWPGVAIDVVAALAIGRLMGGYRPGHRRGAAAPSDRLRVLGECVAIGFLGYIAAATVLWPWHRTWGVTPQERALTLPGDRSPRLPSLEVTHGVLIDAPPEEVWPWLAQIGQDRAGFYSYDWLERLFMVDIRNVDQIRPEWQVRRVGDFVRATQPDYLGGMLGSDLGWYVTEAPPNHALVLHHWGSFVLLPYGARQTKLIVRSTMSEPGIPVWAAALSFTAFELPHFIMERRMLLGIKARTEQASS